MAHPHSWLYPPLIRPLTLIMSAALIAGIPLSAKAKTETVPAIDGNTRIPSTTAWYVSPVLIPSGDASLFDGYPTAQAACEVSRARQLEEWGPTIYSTYGLLVEDVLITGGVLDYAKECVLHNEPALPVYVGGALAQQKCPEGSKLDGSRSPNMSNWGPQYTTTPLECIAPTHCPAVPKGEPEFTLDAGGMTCSREIEDTYTLSLEPDRPSTEPSTALSLTVTIENQDKKPPKCPVPVKISLKVDPKSGGHDHGDSTRPRGSIDDTKCESDDTCKTISVGRSGSERISFIPTDASGIHTVTATCDKCSNSPKKSEVTVKVDGLIPIPASQSYALTDSQGNVIGGEQSKPHHDNHYLTANAIGNLEKLAKLYKNTTNPGSRLYLNDASLKWGGLFDVGSTSWRKPHTTHRLGVEIDIRAAAAANGDPVKEGAIPFRLLPEVWKDAREIGIKAELHCMENRQLVIGMSCYWLPDARHFHVNLR